mmetsp:Transcript_45863/g.121791  ORF Transcript_45863/g.121791 Transcript_45863/m.121791 type:complete len:84 (-) Transcript_45863:191-442(-)
MRKQFVTFGMAEVGARTRRQSRQIRQRGRFEGSDFTPKLFREKSYLDCFVQSNDNEESMDDLLFAWEESGSIAMLPSSLLMYV